MPKVNNLCVNLHIFFSMTDGIILLGKKIFTKPQVEFMTLSKAVATRLDEYLFARKITLYQLAKDAGISIASLQNLYRENTKSPTLALLYKICRGLDVSAQEFLSSDLFSSHNIELD